MRYDSHLHIFKKFFVQCNVIAVTKCSTCILNLYFVDPNVKVNGQRYSDVLLIMRDLLHDIRQCRYSYYFTFQQNGTPAHRAHDAAQNCQTPEKVVTSDFIQPNLWPPNSSDLNPVDCKAWDILQEWVYKTNVKRHQQATTVHC